MHNSLMETKPTYKNTLNLVTLVSKDSSIGRKHKEVEENYMFQNKLDRIRGRNLAQKKSNTAVRHGVT